MSLVYLNDSTLTGIADAIREKGGTTDTYLPSEMAAAIESLTVSDGSGGDTTYTSAEEVEW